MRLLPPRSGMDDGVALMVLLRRSARSERPKLADLAADVVKACETLHLKGAGG